MHGGASSSAWTAGCARRTVARAPSVVLVEAEPKLGGQIQTERERRLRDRARRRRLRARSEALPELARQLGHRGRADRASAHALARLCAAARCRSSRPAKPRAFSAFKCRARRWAAGIRTLRTRHGQPDRSARRARSRPTSRSAPAVRSTASSARRAATGSAARRRDAIDAERLVTRDVGARAASRLLAPADRPAGRAAVERRSTTSSVTVSLGVRSRAPSRIRSMPRASWSRPRIRCTACAPARSRARSSTRAHPRTKSACACSFARATPTSSWSPTPASRSARELSRARCSALTAPPERALGLALAPRAAGLRRRRTSARRRASSKRSRAAGIALAGSAFHGAGIDAAVRSALRTRDATSASEACPCIDLARGSLGRLRSHDRLVLSEPEQHTTARCAR